MAQLTGKTIGFKLEMAAEKCRQEGEDCIVWRKDERSDDVQSNKDRLVVVETKGFIQWFVLEKKIEAEKHEENV